MTKVKLLTLVSVFSLLSYESGGMNVPGRTKFTPQEDQRIYQFIQQHGRDTRWGDCARFVGGGRNARQCRERWINYLAPAESASNVWSSNEDQILIKKHSELGNKWYQIAAFLPGRSDTAVKNRWQKLEKKGIVGTNVISNLLQVENQLNGLQATINNAQRMLSNVTFNIMFQPLMTQGNQNAQNPNPTNLQGTSNGVNLNQGMSNETNSNSDNNYYFDSPFDSSDIFGINDSDQNFEPSNEQGTGNN